MKHEIQDPTRTAGEAASLALAANPMEIGKDREPSTLEPTDAHIRPPSPSLLSLPDGFGVEMGISVQVVGRQEMRDGSFHRRKAQDWPWGGESKQESKETIPTLPNIVAPTPQRLRATRIYAR